MALVAPVNLPYNIKTLWFDPEDIELHADDKVVVETGRGIELGVMASDPFEVPYEELKKLKSPLKPVKRVATEDDLERAEEMDRRAHEAMPIFKKMAREHNEDMHPVSVEFMLDGDKAVFYFESEERIDFRELVRKLASEFHVRIDMRQIGVRDEARIVGGIAHCGQLVCCKRLGGEFKPVSIRMAKDQDLSLNPQKISGLCGRLMCCLRYEEEVYKEFKQTAPKIGAAISTPDGEGKVVEYDVPRDTVSVRIADEKPIKVPLSGIAELSEDRKSAVVTDEAWEEAVAASQVSMFGNADLLSMASFTGEDKLGAAVAVHHEQSQKEKPAKQHRRSSSRRSGGKGAERGGAKGSDKGSEKEAAQSKRKPRRRSTTIKAKDGSQKKSEPQKKVDSQKKGDSQRQGSSQRKSSQALRPGHKSSGLKHDDNGNAHGTHDAPKGEANGDSKGGSSNHRRRRRRHTSRKGGEQQAPSVSSPKGE